VAGPAPKVGLKYTELLLPSLRRGTHVLDHGKMGVAGVRAMLALEKFRAATGEYPAALEELVPAYLPEVPVDPWSGGPLVYRRIEETAGGWEYMLYSVGNDRTDDGGKALVKDRQYSVLREPETAGNKGMNVERWDYVVNCE
jgi:hypothetical protein